MPFITKMYGLIFHFEKIFNCLISDFINYFFPLTCTGEKGGGVVQPIRWLVGGGASIRLSVRGRYRVLEVNVALSPIKNTNSDLV